MLEKLPKIKDDSIFNKKNSQLKIINKKYDNDNTNSHLYNPKEFKRTNSNFRNFNNTHAFAMNKDEWFKTNKNNFYSKDTVETVNYYQDVNKININIFFFMFIRDILQLQILM